MQESVERKTTPSRRRTANGTAAGRKIYVLDTSVLLHRPQSIFSFETNTVVIPIVVLDELDQFKRGSRELNRNARHVIKYIDRLREKGQIDQGVRLRDGGTLIIELTDRDELHLLPAGFETSNDNRILASALSMKHDNPKKRVVLVSKDINMRVKADAVGLEAEDYKADKISVSELYTGQSEVEVPQSAIDQLYQEKEMPLEVIRPSMNGLRLLPNQFLTLRNAEGVNQTALGRVDVEKSSLSLVRDLKSDVWGIRPLNREQRFALDLLLDDRIKLVTLVGKAGTGKTILAIATGLHKVLNDKTHRRLTVYRPVVPMGKDIGFLPGTEQEKLVPWMQPIFDNLEFLLEGHGPREYSGRGNKQEAKLQYLVDSGALEIKALTYIRGRSLPYQFIVIDEAQNLTPHEIKTIVTRAGEGTKLVVAGDPYQIDHPYLDFTSNGLTHLVEKFKNHPIAGHVTLAKGERSELAEIASSLLD
ncbi:MAG: PhoH family protein [Candidatus Xenobia bacterium]